MPAPTLLPARKDFSAMLESLVRLIEHRTPGMRCSILLLDADGETLRHGAAPSLPADYCAAIDRLRIGPGVGSCGTAAFSRRTTIVNDIATDPYWANYRDVALPHGLRACWSTPIMATGGECLGTFAMYYDEPRSPGVGDMGLISTAGLLAGALVERERLLDATERAHAELATTHEELEHQQAELEATNNQLQETAVELETANTQLQENAVELEVLNQQLQDNATELEMQAEALEVMNAELRASEERMRDVFEQSPIAIAVLEGPELRYSIASPSYLSYVGAREVIGRPMAEVLPELSTTDTIDVLQQVYGSGESYHAAERHVRIDRDQDGVAEDYYFNVGYTPLRDRTGAVYAIAIASLDVTDQVFARRELEVARAEAEQANRAKSEFLATMSHELRTPLNAIAGYADLLLAGVRGELTAVQRNDVERMKRSGEHLLGLINDILNFARLEAGRVEFHVADLPVAPLLQSLEELVRPQVDTRALRYSQSIASQDLMARGDAEKVRQVLLNLVTNAVKFTDPGGEISVGCESDDDCVRLVVRDTGRGIAEDHLARIFDPFVQVDRERTTQSQQGVGLGLSISRDLAAGMGGSLTVSSRQGEGSTFVLTLPRPTVSQASGAGTSSATSATGTAPATPAPASPGTESGTAAML